MTGLAFLLLKLLALNIATIKLLSRGSYTQNLLILLGGPLILDILLRFISSIYEGCRKKHELSRQNTNAKIFLSILKICKNLSIIFSLVII